MAVVKGELVRELQRRWKNGETASALVEVLFSQEETRWSTREYFEEAFALDHDTALEFNYAIGLGYGTGELPTPKMVRWIDGEMSDEIRAKQEEWDRGDSVYVDVVRPNDREAFIAFCREYGLRVFVRPASHLGAPLVDKPGYAPWVPPEGCRPREDAPHRGALCVDPSNDPLIRVLAAQKISVSSEEEGSILTNAAGQMLFETYELLAVVDEESWANAWTPLEGSKFRAELNERLGAELILNDPSDLHEGIEADELYVPRLPVLGFMPEGNQQRYSEPWMVPVTCPDGGLDWGVPGAEDMDDAEDSEGA